MIIDTSAIIGILQDEPERRRLTEGIEAAEARVIGAATFVEASIVMEARLGAEGVRDFDLLVAKAGIEIVDVDEEQAHAARRAFSRFGKGRHPAGLNFGDCFSFALAEMRGERLLYKGDDFTRAGFEPF